MEWTLGFVLAEIRSPFEGDTSSSPPQQQQQQQQQEEKEAEGGLLGLEQERSSTAKASASSWLAILISDIKEKIAAIAGRVVPLFLRLWDTAKAVLELAISKITNSKFVF